MNCRRVHFGMPRLQRFMHHYLPQSELFRRIENLDYGEIMKVRQRRNSSGKGSGLGRLGSVKFCNDLRGMT